MAEPIGDGIMRKIGRAAGLYDRLVLPLAMYHDHLEVTNPGGLHSGITPEKLTKPHESKRFEVQGLNMAKIVKGITP